jgi:hypothetical protein
MPQNQVRKLTEPRNNFPAIYGPGMSGTACTLTRTEACLNSAWSAAAPQRSVYNVIACPASAVSVSGNTTQFASFVSSQRTVGQFS